MIHNADKLTDVDLENPVNEEKMESAMKDWRKTLFGEYLLQNPSGKREDTLLIPTETALDDNKYSTIAIFFSADYCPRKSFYPVQIRMRQFRYCIYNRYGTHFTHFYIFYFFHHLTLIFRRLQALCAQTPCQL